MNTIEAIRNEIERRKKKYLFDDQPMIIGRYYEDRDLLAFIDSLPEEPAPKGYDEAYLNECIAKASKTWEGVDVDKFMDEVRGNRPKLSDNLEDAARQIVIKMHPSLKDCTILGDRLTRGQLMALVKAGAQWQKDQMMDEWLEDRGGCFFDGVEEGKEAMKKQMMKDAVEGEVIKTDKHTSVRYKSFYGTDRYFYGIADKQFKPGEKVRIIIVKEDER